MPRAAVAATEAAPPPSIGAPAAADTPPDGPTVGPHLAYMPALDGMRAIAVMGVLAYHGGISWLPGGFLGVDAFFVLSGFLITSLLVREWSQTGTIALGAFWARRARRLLPALFAVVLFVVCYAAWGVPAGTYPDLRADALSALFYVANWHFIVSGSNYFAQSALTSPLTHTWSLAIEEQFYLVWPVVVVLILTRTRRLRTLWWTCLASTVGSALEMVVLFHGGSSLTRLYYGTDTHAQSLLAGATLAVALGMITERRRAGLAPDPSLTPTSRRGRLLLAVLGAAGIAACAVLWWRATGSSSFLYDGGFLVAALSAGAVLAAAVCDPNGLIARALSLRPLRYVGRISYGVYLWHYPLFIWLDAARTGLEGAPLFVLRCAITFVVASISFFLLERPIRHGRVLRSRRAWVAAPAAAAICAAAIVVMTVPTGALSGTLSHPSVRAAHGAPGARAAPLRVLTIGDSTALTLGIALSQDAASYGITQRVEAILGCGVTDGREVRATGTVLRVANACYSGRLPPGTPRVKTVPTPYGVTTTVPDAEQWKAWYRHWVAVDHPNVVIVLAGRWEIVTRTFDGAWTTILHPAFAAYVAHELASLVRIASAKGARVVLMTAPCYDSGEQPDGQPWPTESRARVAAYNRIVAQVAARFSPVTSVYDLHAQVCPHGVFHAELGGVLVRSADGVHFSPAGGAYLGPRVWPFIARIGRAQRAGLHH